MGTPFLAEIKIVSFNFAPRGWASCNGQLLPINQNQALFSLLGTTYGGNGQTTFALPDLRSRVPIHFDSSNSLGTKAGQEFHTLTLSEMPAHNHLWQASANSGDSPSPGNCVLARANNLYAKAVNLTTLHPSSVSNVGGSQAHENRQPFLALQC